MVKAVILSLVGCTRKKSRKDVPLLLPTMHQVLEVISAEKSKRSGSTKQRKQETNDVVSERLGHLLLRRAIEMK